MIGLKHEAQESSKTSKGSEEVSIKKKSSALALVTVWCKWLTRGLKELKWYFMTVIRIFWNDPKRLFYFGVFPALHFITLALLLVLVINFEDKKGIYFTQLACLQRLAYKEVCIRYHPNGDCDYTHTLDESVLLRGKYILDYIKDQVESIFPDKSSLGDNLKHTDLVGNLTIRQYRIIPRKVQSILPGASASPEWNKDLQDLTPPDPHLFPFHNYIHTRTFHSKTTTYPSTPHAYVLLSSTETHLKESYELKEEVLERVKALKDADWVDANSRTVVLESAFHKQDDNVFVHLSIIYEKKCDYWKFSTKFLGAHLSTYLFIYPNEEAIQHFAHTEKKLFVSNKTHLITLILFLLPVTTITVLIFETPHLWRLHFTADGLTLFLLNIIMTILQAITIKWVYDYATHLREEVNMQLGNFYNMDVYPLLHTASWLTRTVVVQIWVHMLKQLYMPAYFHPVINDLLRRLRAVIPVFCRLMFFLIVMVCPFGALMTSLEGWDTFTHTSLEVFSSLITGIEYHQYHFIFFPIIILFHFMLIPLIINFIVEGAESTNVTQEEILTRPITPQQLRKRQLRLEIREMVQNLLAHRIK